MSPDRSLQLPTLIDHQLHHSLTPAEMSPVGPVGGPPIAVFNFTADDSQYDMRTWPVVLGRKTSKANQIDCAMGSDKTVSRKHATMTIDTNASDGRPAPYLLLQCLGRNRAHVNDIEYRAENGSVQCFSGDTVQIGSAKFVVSIPVPSSTVAGIDADDADDADDGGMLAGYAEQYTFREPGSLGINLGEVTNPLDEAGPTLAGVIDVDPASVAAREHPVTLGAHDRSQMVLVVLEVNSVNVMRSGFDGTLDLIRESGRPLCLKLIPMDTLQDLLRGPQEIRDRGELDTISATIHEEDELDDDEAEDVDHSETSAPIGEWGGRVHSPTEADTSESTFERALLSSENVAEMAEYLGIKESERHLLFIAEEALLADLPPGFEERVDDDKVTCYVIVATNQVTYVHPNDEIYEQLLAQERAKAVAAEVAAAGGPVKPSAASAGNEETWPGRDASPQRTRSSLHADHGQSSQCRCCRSVAPP